MEAVEIIEKSVGVLVDAVRGGEFPPELVWRAGPHGAMAIMLQANLGAGAALSIRLDAMGLEVWATVRRGAKFHSLKSLIPLEQVARARLPVSDRVMRVVTDLVGELGTEPECSGGVDRG